MTHECSGVHGRITHTEKLSKTHANGQLQGSIFTRDPRGTQLNSTTQLCLFTSSNKNISLYIFTNILFELREEGRPERYPLTSWSPIQLIIQFKLNPVITGFSAKRVLSVKRAL